MEFLKARIAPLVFFGGLLPFGLFYYRLKHMIEPSWRFVVASLIYIVLLNLVALWLHKHLNGSSQVNDESAT